MANYQVSINPDSNYTDGQLVKLLIDGANINGEPMDQQAYWFKVVKPTIFVGGDYIISINPDSDFSLADSIKLQIEAKNDSGDVMDILTSWFRTPETVILPGKNYQVMVNPDVDFNLTDIVKLQIEAVNDLGVAMDLLASWFKSLEPVVISGNNYHIIIDPGIDFANGQIAYLQIEANNLLSSPMDVYLTWFHLLEAFPGYHVMINPDMDFEEMSIINLEIAAANTALLSLLETLWFETEHFDVLVNILPGYPDVGIISKNPGFNIAVISWEVNKKVGSYQVEVGGTGKDTGVIIGSAHGSQNVQGNLPGLLTPIETLINGGDLEAASPDSGDKRLNIYVTDQWGYSNDYEV